ncbi:histidine triad (HIT) family protein [Tissierella praeacuta DSM 18095]|uniref:Histidine triad (HIT) family protein n=1 Tax=Tissierella praeacuta DSM 18095 TaxID=1123404 RepID=A0A1M4S8M8_9FIRM|nr:histidine triad nucleotide-binding protein [Tissierella praeacuta]SHE28528.1 histidine triad (HIT) family protein [Tissierella praeacuta DSM 18095]SUP01113.1 HIT-like protein HI_0961 [Tissierella praeacuta]
MTNCLFCKIVNGEIPSNLIYEDERVVAFEDINPQAPIHYLVIPKKHIQSAAHLEEKDKELIGHIFFIASQIAKDKGLDEGYRIVNNCGIDGGQTVEHLHFHILGKRKMLWPPG